MNIWKISTVALSMALSVVASGAAVKSASAQETKGGEDPLAKALSELQAAKADLKVADDRHHHLHRESMHKTEEAIRAVEKEIAHEGESKKPPPVGKPPPETKPPPTQK